MSNDPVRSALVSALGTLQLGRAGSVGALVVKPAETVHELQNEVVVRVGHGFIGDHPYKSYWKGKLIPGRDVTAISAEVAAILGFDPATVGDNLVTVGLDLRTLCAGDQIKLGSSVVLERASAIHRPCAKFRARTSEHAYELARAENYRGALFKVVSGGPLAVGDKIEVMAGPQHADQATREEASHQ